MRRAVHNVIILALSLVVTLVIAEIAVRALLRKEPRSTVVPERPKYYFLPKESPTSQDWAYTAARKEGVFRIVVLGDSFSFAPDMQFDDAFPKRLERFLNLNVPHGASPKAEVINKGVPGNGSQHLLASLRSLPPDGADLVISQITLNDPQARPLSQEPEEVQKRFGRIPLDAGKNPILSHWQSLRLVLERLHNMRSVGAYIEYHHKLFEETATWQGFASAYQDFKSECDERKIRCAAVIFPLFDFPIDKNYPFASIHQKITTHLKSLDLPVLDLQKAFSGLPVQRLQLTPGADSHPNEIAHRIAAEKLLIWLKRKKLIPEELMPIRITSQRDHLHEATTPIGKPR